MRLRELVDTSGAVRATRSRTAKRDALAALLAQASPEEVPAAVAFGSGTLLQRQIGVGHALISGAPAPAAEPSLTIAEVARTFARVGTLANSGSVGARRELVHGLLARADADEQRFLIRLLLGDLG